MLSRQDNHETKRLTVSCITKVLSFVYDKDWCFLFPHNFLECSGIKFGTDSLGSMVLQKIGKEGIDGATS